MTGRTENRRRLAAAALPWIACLALGCPSPGHRSAGGEVRTWADGPVRWLMLPEEARQFRRLRTNREILAFIEEFWSRRDHDPAEPGNGFTRFFYDRVDAADRLYSDAGERGSLTDRGRALILLGPPPVLGYSQRAAPTLEPGKGGGRPLVNTRRLTLETWTYGPDDLAPELRELLAAQDRPLQVELVFVVEPRRSYLIEGEKLLELAARAAVLRGAG